MSMFWNQRKEENIYITLENGKVVRVNPKERDTLSDEELMELAKQQEQEAESNEKTADSLTSNNTLKKADQEKVKKTRYKDNEMYKKLFWIVLLLLVTFELGKIFYYSWTDSKKEIGLNEVKTTKVDNNGDQSNLSKMKIKMKDETSQVTSNIVDDDDDSLTTSQNGTMEDMLIKANKIDAENTSILNDIREWTIQYLDGNLSEGKYQLELIHAKTKASGNLTALDTLEKFSKSNIYVNYLILKNKQIEDVIHDLQTSNNDSMIDTFNSAVDIYNYLSEQEDNEYTHITK